MRRLLALAAVAALSVTASQAGAAPSPTPTRDTEARPVLSGGPSRVGAVLPCAVKAWCPIARIKYNWDSLPGGGPDPAPTRKARK